MEEIIDAKTIYKKILDQNDRSSDIFIRYEIEGYTLEELAKRHNITRERIRQILIRFKRKWKLPL